MVTSAPLAAKPRYEILDGLRGVAAAFVVAFHLLESYCVGDHTRQFFRRRLIRLHPMVIFGTAFGALLFYFGESSDFQWHAGKMLDTDVKI